MKARKTPFSIQRKATPPIKNIFHASPLKPTGIRYIGSPQKGSYTLESLIIYNNMHPESQTVVPQFVRTAQKAPMVGKIKV